MQHISEMYHSHSMCKVGVVYYIPFSISNPEMRPINIECQCTLILMPWAHRSVRFDEKRVYSTLLRPYFSNNVDYSCLTHKYGPVRAPGKAKCHRRAKVQGRAYEPSSDLIPQSVGALVVQKLFLELGKIISVLLELIKAILGYARTNR